MKGTNLGEFEEMVLLASVISKEEAYGYGITKALSTKYKRKISLSAVHSALKRLEEKGYLTSKLASGTTSRGGKPRRLFRITTIGQKVLGEVMRLRQSMWSDIPVNEYKILTQYLEG